MEKQWINESELKRRIATVIGTWHGMQADQTEIAYRHMLKAMVPSNHPNSAIGESYEFLYFWHLIPLLGEMVTNHVDHTDILIQKGQ